MIRKFLLFVLLAALITLETKAQSIYKIKKDTIPLKKTERSLLVEIPNKDIEWVSTAVINKKLSLFYGSNNDNSNIYVTTSKNNFNDVCTDTITNLKWFVSTKNSSVTPILYKGKNKFPLFIYSSRAPFKNYIFDKYFTINNSSKNLSEYFVPDNTIIKIVTTNSEVTRAFYLDNRFNKGVVMCIYSKDNGTTWSYPEISISDNIISFRNCSIAIDRKGILYAILTDVSNRVFLCKSFNHGMTWSYPEKLSHRLFGTEHSITINRSGVYILFKSLHKDITNGGYIVWNGSINELNNGAYNGQKVVVMEKYIVQSHNVRNMKIEHFKGNKYIIYGIMKQDSTNIINSYLFKGRFYL